MPIGNAKMAGIAAEDIGKCAYGIFKNGDEYFDKNVGIAGEHLSGVQMADALSNALGEPVVYNNIPAAVYRSFGFPGAEDLGNMFQIYDEFEEQVNGLRDVKVSKQLNPALQNLEQWLAQNAKLIPL